jgi:CMP-N-acetylneuraminic acid synthetase
MKTIAIIPARGGSIRLPQKNILQLGGIPLIAHSILYAQANSKLLMKYMFRQMISKSKKLLCNMERK